MAMQTTKGRGNEPTPLMPAQHERPQLTQGEVRQLIALLGEGDLIEITIERPEEGLRLSLRRTIEPQAAAAPLTAIAPVAGTVPTAAAPLAVLPAPVAVAPELRYVTAPLVGNYFPALRTGQPPLVAVGDVVREGQIIAGIESLRVMNEVEADVAGTVVEILVPPGHAVEYGQRLLALAPADA